MGEKCYILKDARNEKFDVKSDESIFLGYSTRSKAYKCLNTNANKIVESANVNFDEYMEVHNAKSIKRLEEYKSFVYFCEGIPSKEEVANQAGNQQQVSVTCKSWLVNVELNSGTELHSGAKIHNEVEAHSNYEISVHERDAKLPDRDVHSDIEIEKPNEETKAKPRLSKYVKRHHHVA